MTQYMMLSLSAAFVFVLAIFRHPGVVFMAGHAGYLVLVGAVGYMLFCRVG